MPHHRVDPNALAARLTAEHGDLPAGVVRSTVDRVCASAVGERDPLDAERLADAEIAAMTARRRR